MLLALAPSCAVAQDDVVVITATRQPQPASWYATAVSYAVEPDLRGCLLGIGPSRRIPSSSGTAATASRRGDCAAKARA